jgi:hypothetical protein
MLNLKEENIISPAKKKESNSALRLKEEQKEEAIININIQEGLKDIICESH